jgi:hypothetical protein
MNHTHCPLCGKVLTYWGDEPSCSNCVIDGKREELIAALRLPPKAIKFQTTKP